MMRATLLDHGAAAGPELAEAAEAEAEVVEAGPGLVRRIGTRKSEPQEH